MVREESIAFAERNAPRIPGIFYLPSSAALHVRQASLPGKDYHIGRLGDQDRPAGPASTECRRRLVDCGKIAESVDDMSSATVTFAVE